MLLQPRAGGAGAGPAPSARLGYCLNLHPSESLGDVIEAIQTYAIGVRDRVQPDRSKLFGVGMYLGADAARHLVSDDSALSDLAAMLAEERIDPFTFNAFPYGRFQVDGLKQQVYAPNWTELERLVYTVDVARVAARLRGKLYGVTEPGYVSISTHPGAYGPSIHDRSALRQCAEHFGRAVEELARIEDESGVRIVLSLESEPDASARNNRALAEFNVFARLVGTRVLQDEFGRSLDAATARMGRHLGTCLDCCHSAVEFETAEEACELATREGPLGKVQFSSALRVPDPAKHPEASQALLALDEPRFLHQVTANSRPPTPESFLHLPDLPNLDAELRKKDSPWHVADEWRCHFHVPVDMEGAGVLETTRDHADAVLGEALATPDTWSTPELHVEIETYTWNVLPDEAGAVASDEELIDGIAREYDHVLGVCAKSGWHPAE